MVSKILFFVLTSLFVFSTAEECGKLHNVNIEDKNINLPWTVQLRERSTSEIICVGTLISNRHILIGMTSTFLFCLHVVDASTFAYIQLPIVCGRSLTLKHWRPSRTFTLQLGTMLWTWWISKFTPIGSLTKIHMMPTLLSLFCLIQSQSQILFSLFVCHNKIMDPW